jgi:protein-tyrosine phosphatase
MSLIIREHHAALYIGDVNTIKDADFLKDDLRIKCLINCSCDLEFPDPPQNFDNFSFVEKRVPIENFIGVYIIPLFEQVVDFIQKTLVENKQNILIYSFNGRSRSTTFIIAYFMRIRGMTLRDAIDELERIHPSCQPNESFIHQLMILDKQIHGKASIQVKIKPQQPTWVTPAHIIMVSVSHCCCASLTILRCRMSHD